MEKNQTKSESKRRYGTWIKTEVLSTEKTFTSNVSGVKDRRNTNIQSAFDAVLTLWPEHIWQSIVNSTNERARLEKAGWGADDAPEETLDQSESFGDKNNDKEESDSSEDDGLSEDKSEEQGTASDWQNTYVAELKIWFGILMVMGLCLQPSLRNYWSKEQTSQGIFGNDFIRKSEMSRDRWLQIRRFLFCDINWLTGVTQDNSQKMWRPFPFMAIDETLLLFKGKFKPTAHQRKTQCYWIEDLCPL